MNITPQAYELVKIFTEVHNAHTRAVVLTREKGVSGSAKAYLKTSIVNRLNAIISDIKYLFKDNPQDLQVMMDDVLNDEAALQIDSCITMMMALPKGIRDEVETYISQRHSIYAKKIA